MLEDCRRVYRLVRVISISLRDGRESARWSVYATECPDAPLAIDFGDGVHRYKSPSRLSRLIAEKMFQVL